MNTFTIKLLDQYWITKDPNDDADLCSHGKIYLQIDGIDISSADSPDWTVASTALRLMKSAIDGYDRKEEFEMIPCCGYLMTFPSCPTYITWDVRVGDTVLANI